MDSDSYFLNTSKHVHLTGSSITLKVKCQSAHLALSDIVSDEHIASEKAVFSLGSVCQLCSCLLPPKNIYKDMQDPNMRIWKESSSVLLVG